MATVNDESIRGKHESPWYEPVVSLFSCLCDSPVREGVLVPKRMSENSGKFAAGPVFKDRLASLHSQTAGRNGPSIPSGHELVSFQSIPSNASDGANDEKIEDFPVVRTCTEETVQTKCCNLFHRRTRKVIRS